MKREKSMKTAVIGIWLILAMALAMPSSVHAIGLEVAIGGWNQDPQGDIAYKPIGSSDSLNLERDLKYDTESKIMGRIKIDMPLFVPNIYIMGTQSEFDGTGDKRVNFRFGDRTFRANIDFYSKIRLPHYDIALYYGLPFIQIASANMLHVEAGLNVRIVDFEAKVRQPDTGISESKSLIIPIPMVYLGVQFSPVKKLAIELEGRGISYSGNSLYSFMGRVKFKPKGPFFISGGYRYDKIKIDESRIDADAEFTGPFAEIGLQF